MTCLLIVVAFLLGLLRVTLLLTEAVRRPLRVRRLLLSRHLLRLQDDHGFVGDLALQASDQPEQLLQAVLQVGEGRTDEDVDRFGRRLPLAGRCSLSPPRGCAAARMTVRM